MIDINKILTEELGLQSWQVENALALKNEGATLPFIARYRKERTGELDENVLRDMFDRFEYLTELEERKKTILDSIEEQGKLTDELKEKIEKCLKKTELEDLYLPYKPKKRTKATIAKEKGLEPLAIFVKDNNKQGLPPVDLEAEAAKYISSEKEVADVKEALKGAADIIAEEIAETAEYRQWIREFFLKEGVFTSKIKDEFEEGSTKYEMYRDFEVPVRDIASHTMLALRRGETEGILVLDLKYDEDRVLDFLASQVIESLHENIYDFYNAAIKDGFIRLMKHSIIGEVRLDKKVYSDEESIKVFESNLRQMLLAAPAGLKPTIGLDPGFRTGCKMVVVDATGKYIQYDQIFPHNSANERARAATTLLDAIKKHNIELIAIGNGTAGRETDQFVQETLKDTSFKLVKVMVNEAGASVYSASKVANEEFPDLDLTVRGAISIARRLQDPLAELVKIDPKSIGVGQYQHDVDQRNLKKKLEETVESCVNYVGVDLNTASKELLTYVSGITATVAKSIVEYRNENGMFSSRKDLLSVPRFGKKAFEQAAGFLRIREGKDILDNTAVHPESYHIVEQFAKDLNVNLTEITKVSDKLQTLDLKKYITDTIGEPTLRDIIAELEKPGRDPREEFKYAKFAEGINEIKDLRQGMELEGVVTNITNFGAFIDIGVHQDGLVHVSEMANFFVKDPTKVVKVGQIVKVKVIEVNEKLKRINLSMKQVGGNNIKKPEVKKQFNVNDLKSRFSS
jgi:uncharacterized protein